jgi:cysteine desulfurase/selenocysteine lyase
LSSPAHSRSPRLDLAAIRADFPILARRIFDRPLVYLDSAASSQKPRQVLEALDDYYRQHHANVHRGVHTLSSEATDLYEAARRKLARFLGATSERECVFVRGTTEAINLVSQAWARPRLGPGDEVLISEMEHHSNLVPWQIVCGQTGARLVVAPFDDSGELVLSEFRARLSARTRVVALTHVSNVLGTVNPVAELAALARARGALVVIDGAQAVPHLPVNVRELGCDFYAFSGHKTYGPTGIGVLWGSQERLAETGPWQGGGSMIRSVSFEKTSYADPPERFEAGTPDIAGAIGLGAAIDWLEALGMPAVDAHEQELIGYAQDALAGVAGLRLIGQPRRRAGALSFVTGDVHPHDLGTFLDREGIAVRVGHHCAQPIMTHYGIPATTRASFGVHNGTDDIDALVAGIRRVLEFFA